MKKISKIMVCLILLQPMQVQAEGAWDYRLTPYIWFAGIEGDVATIPGAGSIPIKITPSDALSDTDISFTLLFEAKKDRHGVFFDFLYSDLRSDTDLIPSINLTMQSISKTTIFSTAYLYELYKQDQTIVDVFTGLRYWNIDTELGFGGGFGILAGQKIQHSESWVDPLVGIKARTPIANTNFYVAGGIVTGGLGFGSDGFYDITANIGYQWNKAIGTTLGYRLFDVDYKKDDFLYDIKQDGLILGINWVF